MKLGHHSYGKARVRVVKVFRRGRRQSIKEIEVSVMLQGRFESSYKSNDNHLVVPTDTVKNTVNVLAHQFLGTEIEPFGIRLCAHFLDTYRQISQVDVRISERCWQRINGHSHSFLEQGSARPTAEITATRTSTLVQSGVENLLILKTTASGFEGYVQDKFTTLRETKDRILRTKLNAIWTHKATPATYAPVNQRVTGALLKTFVADYSPSVQFTLFAMGEAALKAATGISKISLSMPNQHCLLIDLSPFDLANHNELFVPTDEPHGQIEGTVER